MTSAYKMEAGIVVGYARLICRLDMKTTHLRPLLFFLSTDLFFGEGVIKANSLPPNGSIANLD